MYGFGPQDGIVSYQTKRAIDTPLLATTIGYRNDRVFSAQLDAGGRANGPDSFGYRLNAGIDRGDAYTARASHTNVAGSGCSTSSPALQNGGHGPAFG
ncbi:MULTISPECIES: hypothetical protein [Xanthomonas]|uniref:hypothetical protein n=1 Tax=Xanthomonas TaxID=338 RepID=UPI001D036D2B|nr:MULTISPECIES: hypothetical protein [Xanthomonas]MCW0455913.1 hypothetical protein [Xanthomonas sacchari]